MQSAKTKFVRLINVRRRIGKNTIIHDLSLDIDQGEFLTLLGPSGSGKTTTLNLVAGFDKADRGGIVIADRDVSADPPYLRDIGMVFQSYALFPHLTIEENVAFPLRMRKFEENTIRANVERVLALVRMEGLNERYPSEISGGQAQRVSIARAIVFEPRLLLMDEPLGALDRQLRAEMQFEIQALHKQLGITILYVTHDQEEALSMSSRIAVLKDGRLEQCAEPRHIYDHPANRFVAGFVGETNFLRATANEAQGSWWAECESLPLRIPLDRNASWTHGQALYVSIRPEYVSMHAPSASSPTANVEQAQYLGDAVKCRLTIGSTSLVAKVSSRTDADLLTAGSRVTLDFEPHRFQVYAS
jgi:putative spermidine/putrescine transport system ATP-binding protein